MTDELLPGLVLREDRDVRTFSNTFDANDPVDPQAKAEPTVSFGEGYNTLVGENHIGPSIHRALNRDRTTDPEFDGSPERIQSDLDNLGISIPSSWYKEFAYVSNEKDYYRTLQRMEERLSTEEMIADMGGAKGTAAILASYASDPIGFAIDAFSGFGTKGRMLKRFLDAGGKSTAAEMAIQAALSSDGETENPLDIAMGFGAAFVLGGGLGAAFGKRPDTDVLEGHFRILGASEESFGGAADSVGAARVNALPSNPLTRDRVDNLNDLRLDRQIDEGETPAFSDVRVDVLARSFKRARKNKAQQRLMLDFLSNPTQKNADRLNDMAGEEIADRVFGGLEGDRVRTTRPAFNQWLENKYQMGKSQRAGTAVFKGSRYADLEDEFNQQVKRYIDSEGKLEVDPEIKQAADAHLNTMKAYRQKLIDNGVVDPDKLSKSDWWFPRMLDRTKAKAFGTMRGGEQALVELFETALKRGREGAGLETVDRVNKAVAKAYVRRLISSGEDGKFSDVDVKYLGEADRDYILDLLEDAKVDPKEIDNVLEVLDAGVKREAGGDDELPGHLRHRLPLDLETTMDFNGKPVRLGDLFETDVEKIGWTYGRWAAGEIALHQKGYSSRGVQKMVREAKEEAAKNPNNSPDAYNAKQVDDLEWAFNRVMGRSLDGDWNENSVRALRMASGLGYITKMGSGWINAFIESTALLAYAGVGRTLRNLPIMKDIFREVAGKKPNKALIRQLNMLSGGIGQTLGRGMHSVRHQASEFVRRAPANADGADRALSKGEDIMEGLKRGASWTNMLSLVTDYSRQMSSVLAMSQLDDILVRGKKAPSWFAKRSKSWGLDEQGQETLRKYLSSGSVKRNKNGAIDDLGELPPDVEKALGDYIFRYTSEAIQDIQGGNLPKFLQNPLGRVIFQFRSFTTAAWVRHTLKDLKHMDTLAGMKLIYTGMFAGLAYTGRQLAFNPEGDKRDKALNPDRIFEGAMRYAVNVSVVPDILSSLTKLTAGEPLFEGARTSGLTSSFGAGSIPSMVYGDDVMQTVQGASDLIRGGEVSKDQFKAFMNVIALDTLWATRPFINRLAEEFPSETSAERNSVDVMELMGLREEE